MRRVMSRPGRDRGQARHAQIVGVDRICTSPTSLRFSGRVAEARVASSPSACRLQRLRHRASTVPASAGSAPKIGAHHLGAPGAQKAGDPEDLAAVEVGRITSLKCPVRGSVPLTSSTPALRSGRSRWRAGRLACAGLAEHHLDDRGGRGLLPSRPSR